MENNPGLKILVRLSTFKRVKHSFGCMYLRTYQLIKCVHPLIAMYGATGSVVIHTGEKMCCSMHVFPPAIVF